MKFSILLMLVLSGCAHQRFGISCSDYCFSQGGSCNYIREGRRDYNTTDGSFTEVPTVFVCRFER